MLPSIDATSVVVQFSGVAFKREGQGPEIVRDLMPTPRQFNLLEFQDGRAALLLDGVTLPAGSLRVAAADRRQRGGCRATRIWSPAPVRNASWRCRAVPSRALSSIAASICPQTEVSRSPSISI